MSHEPLRLTYPELPCEQIVFRSASARRMWNEDTSTFTTTLFLRTRSKDPDGLSVFLGEIDTCEKASRQLRKTLAVGSLHTGRIRSVIIEGRSLNVIQDEPTHGIIAGLPFVEEEPAIAERIATLLVAQVRRCWPP